MLHRSSPEEMAKLVRRVDRMEFTLSAISAKIDSVLSGKLALRKSDEEADVEM